MALSLARALAHRNYRLFFAGQGISLIGTWMQQVAMTWLVYRLTGQAIYLGVVGFCGQIPAFFLAPVAGVLMDRWNLRRTLLLTQTAAMLQAFALWGLDAGGVLQVWHVIALSMTSGLINAFDMPGRQSFVVQMVDRKEDLPNAIALNSSMVNGARLVGPAVAGILIGLAGEATCFLLNALSYLAVIAALAAMRIAPGSPRGPAMPVWSGLKAGVSYAYGFTPIRALLMLLAFTSLAGMPLSTLMPIFAAQVLHGGPQTLGFLTTFYGCGALLAAMTLASRRSVLGLGMRIAQSAGMFGLALMAFAASKNMGLSCGLLLVAGFAMMFQMAATNTLLQTIVDEDKRGRVMGLYAMAFQGMTPLGSLLAGGIADMLGAPVGCWWAGPCSSPVACPPCASRFGRFTCSSGSCPRSRPVCRPERNCASRRSSEGVTLRRPVFPVEP